jgi:two-component system cell cycle response regulator
LKEIAMPFDANILVVDPNIARRTQFASRLGENGYCPIAVDSAASATDVIEKDVPDMVIIEFGGEGSDTFGLSEAQALSKTLKKKSGLDRLLTVFIGELPEHTDPASILAAGADEFLARPINDNLLFRCLKSFVRLSTMQTEFHRRLETNENFGIKVSEDENADITVETMSVLLVGKNEAQIRRLENILGDWVSFVCVWSTSSAVNQLKDRKFDACIMLADSEGIDFLGFCRDVRNYSPLYSLPLLAISESEALENNTEIWQAGYSDVLAGKFNGPLLFSRLMALIAQEHYRAFLNQAYAADPDNKVRDSLTGLYGFGYFHAHLQCEIANAVAADKNLSVAFFAIADMRLVNEEHGYPAGDHLLRQIGTTIGRLLRGEDLAARYGGDEFCIILPNTSAERAQVVVRRLTSILETTDFAISDHDQPVRVSVRSSSVGLEPGETAEALIAKCRAHAVSYSKMRYSGRR